MTRSRLTLPTLTLTVVLAATSLSAGNQDLRRLFPSTAPVTVEGTGLARLPLSPEILSRSRADLSDLRLLADDGAEVAYVIAAAPAVRAEDRPVARFRPEITAVERRQERPRNRPPVYHESYTVAVPELPESAAAWRLRFAVRQTELVCRIDVSARLADGSRRQLISGGSLFRLRRPAARHLAFPLPAIELASLEIRLEGENGGYAEPVIGLEATAAPPEPAPLEVPLALAGQRRLGDRTVVTLHRPPGLVPARLLIGTSTPSFLRPVTVRDVGPDGDRVAGTGQVYRLEAIAPVEQREIRVRAVRGNRLRLEIADGDSPPLEGITCSALVPAPVLLFSPPAGARGLAVYFGGGRTHRPRYDLEAFATGPAAAAWNAASARPAFLGAVTANPAFDPAPALAFLMHAGAELSSSSFSHRRSLEVVPSTEGLARLELRPSDLALCRRDLADLRIADGDGRQRPYLLVGRDAFSAEDVRFDREGGRPGESAYQIALPAAPVEIAGMTVDSTAPFFDRPYRVVGTPPGGGDQILASGRLHRPRGRLLPIRLPVRRALVERLELLVEDGGDAPLQLTRIAVGVQHPALYLPAPAGAYTLYLGDPSAASPRYEIAAARSIVLGVPARAIEAGPLEPNPAYSTAARLLGGGGAQQLILWAVLILAAIVLALLTLRLARKEEEGGEEEGR